MDIFERVKGTRSKVSVKKVLTEEHSEFLRVQSGGLKLVSPLKLIEPNPNGRYAYYPKSETPCKKGFFVRKRSEKLFDLLYYYDFVRQLNASRTKTLEKQGEVIVIKYPKTSFDDGFVIYKKDLKKVLSLLKKGVDLSGLDYYKNHDIIHALTKAFNQDGVEVSEVICELLQKLHDSGLSRSGWFWYDTSNNLAIPFMTTEELTKSNPYADDDNKELLAKIVIKMSMEEFWELLSSRPELEFDSVLFNKCYSFLPTQENRVKDKLLILFESGRLSLKEDELKFFAEKLKNAGVEIPKTLQDLLEYCDEIALAQQPHGQEATKQDDATAVVDEIFSRALKSDEKTDE